MQCGQEGNVAQLRHHKVHSSPAGGEPGQQTRSPLSRWISPGVSRIHLGDSGLKFFNASLVFIPVKAMYKCTKSICFTVSTHRIGIMNR